MRFHFAQSKDESMASYRYRVKAPADYLSSIGWEHVHWANADIVVMGKHFHPARDFALAKELQRRNVPMAFDICDWHFDKPELAAHYKRMCDLATGLIVPNDAWLSMGLPMKPEVAGDGVLLPHKPPVVRVNSPLKILWYGNEANIKFLESVQAPPDTALVMMTKKGGGPLGTLPWSMEAWLRELDACDLVIVPADSPLKSPNRQNEAIQQGRFVVASDLPQHRPSGTWCGNITEGIQWYRTHLQEALARLTAAQAKVSELYSPKPIGEQWRSALRNVAIRRQSRAA